MAKVNIAVIEVGDSKLEVNVPAIQRGCADFAIEEMNGEEIGRAIAHAVGDLDLDQAIVVWLEDVE